MSQANELERLFELDFGDRFEFAVRMVTIQIAALLLYLYNGSMAGAYWSGAFLAGMWAYHAYLKRNQDGDTRRAVMGATVLLAIVQLAYMWLPARLAVQDDMILAVGGVSGIVAMMLFMLRRSDTLLPVIVVEAGILSAVLAGTFVALLPRLSGLLEQICVAFCMAMVAFYFVTGLLKARRLRLTATASALRGTQEQKLASIGRLAGGVAHDFNNALTGISGNLELYFAVGDPKERDELVQAALGSSARAATLVKQLLVFARKSEVSRQLVPAGQLLDDAAAFQRRLLPANIALELAVETEQRVEVDRDLLVTALINLAVNGADAMPSGGRLHLRARETRAPAPLDTADGRQLPPGAYVLLEVADTGTGIPRDLLGRVIEPFFTTKAVGKGSGLGLSMVVGLAQSLSGGVQIETGRGGTCVRVILPARRAQDARTAA